MENLNKQKLVSIVIPCYNEEENINRTFDGLLELAKDHIYDFVVIAVNDGSKDKTWEVIKKYAKKLPRHLQRVILDAVEEILADTEIGELKKGRDL